MAKSRPDTINLKGMTCILKEAKASAVIHPGHNISLNNLGEVQANGAAQVSGRNAYAIENTLLGKGIEDTYAVGDNVLYIVCPSGVEIMGRVAPNAAAIAVGDQLELSNDGTVRKLTNGGICIGHAIMPLDNSAGADEEFIQLEVR